MGPGQSKETRLLIDEPGGTRIRISEETFKGLSSSESEQPPQPATDPAQATTEAGDTVLIYEDAGGTRIRINKNLL